MLVPWRFIYKLGLMNCSKEFAYTSTIRPVDVLDVLTCFFHADGKMRSNSSYGSM